MKTRSIHLLATTLGLAFLFLPAARAEEKPIERLTTEAEKGDADAQYRLGQLYVRGTGVRKDLRKSHDFIKSAADQGHAEAIGALGYFYANGFVVKKDLAAAADWFLKGAEKGGAKAQLNYGKALLNGRGVKQDEAAGMAWMEKAIAQNLPDAWFAKAELLYHGLHGVPQDYGKAKEYVIKAAEADHAPAENMLGSIYQEGLGGEKVDLVKAEIWFRKAAEQGDAKGMSNLGQILGPDGPDASKHVEALKWLLLANRANEPMARHVLNEVLRTRPPEVLKEAQKQMTEFKPRPSTEGRSKGLSSAK